MSYHISYDIPKRAACKVKKKRNLLPAILMFGAIVLCLALRAMGVGEDLLAAFLPGDSELTAAVVGRLVDNLRSGGDVSQAFLEFCVEIIEGGRVS